MMNIVEELLNIELVVIEVASAINNAIRLKEKSEPALAYTLANPNRFSPRNRQIRIQAKDLEKTSFGSPLSNPNSRPRYYHSVETIEKWDETQVTVPAEFAKMLKKRR